MLINKIDPSTFNIIKDEPTTKSQLGVDQNRIVEIPNFVDADTAQKMVNFFEASNIDWGDIAFYGSFGMGIATQDPELVNQGLEYGFFDLVREKIQEAVTIVFGREVKPNTSHAQKWEVGGFASPHSDNSDFEGNPTAFEINKYVAILYLNDDYEGGELYFPDHDISFKPNSGSLYTFPGGAENIHGVSEITNGTRYTMLAFWDFADAEYSEERKAEWDTEIAKVREEQAAQREEWEKGNKYA